MNLTKGPPLKITGCLDPVLIFWLHESGLKTHFEAGLVPESPLECLCSVDFIVFCRGENRDDLMITDVTETLTEFSSPALDWICSVSDKSCSTKSVCVPKTTCPLPLQKTLTTKYIHCEMHEIIVRL